MNPIRSRLAALAAACACTVVAERPAVAAGYDTPMLYSARHMGMGGTAVGAVNDPSSIFHNPAGLGAIKGGALMLDVSPLVGVLHASPADEAKSIDSDLTVAPLFLAGGAYRVWKGLVLGFGAFPVASAGGGYTYDVKDDKGNVKSHDTSTARLAFIELAPSIAYEILPWLRFGAAYRFDIVEFQRKVISTDLTGFEAKYIDLDMKGNNSKGFRAGLQATLGAFDIGLVYRNKTSTIVHDDESVVTGIPATDVDFEFILPSKAAFGLQWRGVADLRLAADVEYAWNSENEKTFLNGLANGTPVPPIPNHYFWQDGLTVRVGGAYKVSAPMEVRLGYAYDRQVTQKGYPSAFGTPPASTQVFTGGLGYSISKNLDLAFAAAYRTGSTTVAKAELNDRKNEKGDVEKCLFCGKEGDYAINLFGAYLDVVWRFGEPDAAPAPSAEPAAADEPAAPPAADPAPAAPAPEAPATPGSVATKT